MRLSETYLSEFMGKVLNLHNDCTVNKNGVGMKTNCKIPLSHDLMTLKVNRYYSFPCFYRCKHMKDAPRLFSDMFMGLGLVSKKIYVDQTEDSDLEISD